MDKTMIVQSLRDFQIERKVGEGSFGSVYKAYTKDTKELVAIKTIQISQNDRKNIENTLTEIRILASLEHENIVSYKAAFLEGSNKVCVVMEYVGGGDLLAKVNKCKRMNAYLPEKQIWKYFIQLLRGLKVLK